MLAIPDFITHYSRGEPFRSLTSLSFEETKTVISSMNETNSWGLNRFRDPDYLNQRLVVERRLYEEFLGLGGKPEIQNPIYFFLGTNSRFEQHPLNRGFQIQLSSLPHGAVSFTYGDSMFGFHPQLRMQAGEKYQNPLCKKLFLESQLVELFHCPDFPSEGPLHIEAQLWITPSQKMVRSS